MWNEGARVGLYAALLAIVGVGCDVRPKTAVAVFGDSIVTGWPSLLTWDTQVQIDGVGGQTCAQVEPRLVAWLASPDAAAYLTVTVTCGTNDVFKTANSPTVSVGELAIMLDAIAAAGKRPLLVDPPPIINPNYATQAALLAALIPQMEAVAQARAALMPLGVYEAFESYPDPAVLLNADGVHPNQTQGQPLIAQLVDTALMH